MQTIQRPLGTCLLFAFIILLLSVIALPKALAQKEDGEPIHRNPQAVDLSIERTGEKSALLKARLPSLMKQKEANILVDGKTFTFQNDGTTGDQFVFKGEFDFAAFAKSNEQLAKLKAKTKSSMFIPGGREQIGVQSSLVDGNQLVIQQSSAFDRTKFALPFDSELIRVGTELKLPALASPLGLPLPDLATRSVEPEKSLMITDLDVVTDPDRTWSCHNTNQPPSGNPTGDYTFWELMASISNGTSSTSDYIKEFFAHWKGDQLINQHNVEARPNVYDAVIAEWEQRSGGPGANLSPEQSPFKLLAIVLRADLRGSSSFYGGGSAGEARFVFSLHDGNCNSMAKTVIFEYKVPINSCANIRSWAQDWIALESSANYKDDLASLVDVFAKADANPSAPNGSAIGQIRTNEHLPLSTGSEMREFVLDETSPLLQQTTVKQEPQRARNHQPELADYVNQQWQNLVNFNHQIPLDFGSEQFLAGQAPIPVLWSLHDSLLSIPSAPVVHANPNPNATNTTEAMFSLGFNTCSGCHQKETGTDFAHIHHNTQPGEEARLSGFLTGISLPDPREPAVMRQFDDLARRTADLEEAATMSCLPIGTFPVVNHILHELTRSPALNAVH